MIAIGIALIVCLTIVFLYMCAMAEKRRQTDMIYKDVRDEFIETFITKLMNDITEGSNHEKQDPDAS